MEYTKGGPPAASGKESSISNVSIDVILLFILDSEQFTIWLVLSVISEAYTGREAERGRE